MRRIHPALVMLPVVLAMACDDETFAVRGEGDADGGGADAGEDGKDPGGPTWYADVQPIFADRCWRCHTAGGGSSFSLEDPTTAAALAGLIVEKIGGDDQMPYYMPPWGAQDTDECSPPAPWVDDWRLLPEQMATIEAWAAAGAPLGDPESAAPAPRPEATSLTGPGIESYTLPTTRVAPGEDIYTCFPIDLGLSSTRWVDGIEIFPDNENVVHHVVLFTDPFGERTGADPYPCYGGPMVSATQTIFAWAPGGQPLTLPTGSGVAFEPGAGLIAQVHYHPTASEEDDASAVAMRWSDTPPAYLAEMAVIGARAELNSNSSFLDDGEFSVPAGAVDHVETWREAVQLDEPVQVWSVFPHMHGLGTEIRIGVEGPDGDRCLSHNDRWDFDWQLIYRYAGAIDALPLISPGDTVEVRCTYTNPSAVEVRVGEDTDAEMCLAIIGVLRPAPALPSEPQGRLAYLVPDGPTVDVWVNGSRVLRGLDPGDVTPSTSLPAGSTTLTVTPADAPVTDPAAWTLGPVTFSGRASVTLAAVGGRGSVEPVVLVDDPAAIAPTDIRVRLIHAAPSAPRVDLRTGDGAPLAVDLRLGQTLRLPDRSPAATTLTVDVDRDGYADLRFAIPAPAAGVLYDVFLTESGAGEPHVLVSGPTGTSRIDPS